MKPDQEKYPALLRLIHWIMAVCIIGMIASGWYMAGLDSDAPGKYDLYPWHKSFGVLLLGLIVIRIISRLLSALPTMQESIPLHERRLAKLAHISLYIFMVMVPLSGFIMSDAGGHDILFFSILLPDLLETDKALSGLAHDIHYYAGYILLAVVVLHVLGALKHRFMDKPENDVLNKML
ncbi:cytochrome b [Sansalvadorimonas sp. 2012CJ34-2]|uniref:Cytochrome b n=1 Tax=Parendozoicomonas callyspongiae TaxID=2942213 RepID=A0ABT0PBL3_9GAMM|nr:cytochrome b [Sansalvadorimonas sp. 2012CJ34-2]MCL6268770.1 cytochrome b [Sansalvadorimonas sp. 2012CJ34-2]